MYISGQRQTLAAFFRTTPFESGAVCSTDMSESVAFIREMSMPFVLPSGMRRVVAATGNRKKGLELESLLASWHVPILTLADFPPAAPVEETGNTFAANAALKAQGQAQRLGEWVLADDSGLAVDALDGAPGVYSARFAGPDANDEANNDLLLERLAGLPVEKRGAQYVCHVCLADPTGEIRATAEDYCRGRILKQRLGKGGFGYDPLFEIVEYRRTFGELSPAVKSCLSHRARAVRALCEIVRGLGETT